MIIIDKTIISSDIYEEKFICDLNKCKGACCVEGDLGAPLELKELPLIESDLKKAKNYLSKESKEILEKDGAYYYSSGWHIKGTYSLILGFIFSASTIWNSNLMFLQSYSWIIGAFIASLVYYLLAKD